jgi:hypothetical protein
MRYVIVDQEGSSRAYLASVREVRAWARALKAQDTYLLGELLLLTFDAAGNEVANQPLVDFVPDVPATISVAMPPIETSSAVGLTGSGLLGGWSGTGDSRTPEFPRQHTPASETGSPVPAGTAVG